MGVLQVKATVELFTTETPSRICSGVPVSAEEDSASKLALTTAASSGDPSEKVTPGRRVTVQVTYSGSGVTDWAR